MVFQIPTFTMVLYNMIFKIVALFFNSRIKTRFNTETEVFRRFYSPKLQFKGKKTREMAYFACYL
jgi:hypothetical protein